MLIMRINVKAIYNFRSILTSVESGTITLWTSAGSATELVDAGENLSRMCHSRVQKNVIATGGKDNKLKLYDLEKQERIFLEKDQPHDWLNLKEPQWISDLNFLPGTQQIATVGRYGHVRNTIFPFE